MKILVAGATGAIGRRLVPLLVEAGHEVSGTTRRTERTTSLRDAGATPIVIDVFDAAALHDAVAEAQPDLIMHQLTDLGAEDFAANGRLRIEGTRNLVDAAKAAGVRTMIAQSIAWVYTAGGGSPAAEEEPLDPAAPPYKSVAALEDAVASMPRGVMLRYGALYGPGTWYATDGAIADRVHAGELARTPAWTSFIHVDDAASAALAALDWPAGPVNVVDDEPATAADWLPVYSEAIGAPPAPIARHAAATGRPISNAKARGLGWKPQYATWRNGFASLV